MGGISDMWQRELSLTDGSSKSSRKRVLFLTTGHNSLSQRLSLELQRYGYVVSVELALSDQVTEEAVALFAPDIVVCPFLTVKVPESIYSRFVTLIVHPGIPGDAGPSSIDYAMLHGADTWGVTVLQADKEFDKGPIWEVGYFQMHKTWKKSSVYKQGVIPTAVEAVVKALHRFFAGDHRTFTEFDFPLRGRVRHLMKQSERAFDWASTSPDRICRLMALSDSQPGVMANLLGTSFYVYGGWVATEDDVKDMDVSKVAPGELLAWRDGAVLVRTGEGIGVWLRQLRKTKVASDGAFLGLHPKLPAVLALECHNLLLPSVKAAVPESRLPYHLSSSSYNTNAKELWYEMVGDHGHVALVYSEFYNGTMSTDEARRMLALLQEVEQLEAVDTVVLMGGADYFSNGIHLCTIDVAADPAAESWANINAIDDVVHAMLTSRKLYISAFRGNAGAGGVVLGAAADLAVCRESVVLNPHYKSMGLYGSEYWTYILPKRLKGGWEAAEEMTESMRPVSAREAQAKGLVDMVWDMDPQLFDTAVRHFAATLHESGRDIHAMVQKRLEDATPDKLGAARARELAHMKDNFWGEGGHSSYHKARYDFVHKIKPRHTPLHFALHRQGPSQAVDMVVANHKEMRDGEIVQLPCLAGP